MPANEKTDDSKLNDALKDFEQLAISPIGEPSCSSQPTFVRKRSQSCTISTISDALPPVQPSPVSSTRFRPYALPRINRLTLNSTTPIKPRTKLPAKDVEEHESSTKSDDDSPSDQIPKKIKRYQSCSQQASSTAQHSEEESNELNCEIDELAEYFAHFVNVQAKMSSLAEAMYT